jgi:tetratricopeptide (TPR) repeat protein
VIVISITACSRPSNDNNRDRETEIPEARDALSEPLMIFLGQAKNYHNKADVYLKEGQVAEAIKAVESILTIEPPQDAAEVEDVVLDARARLAKLLVANGDIERAMKVVDEGLALAKRESFFVANLHTVRGEVFEARAAQSDDPDVASQHRRSAIEAFDKSIQLNTALQKRLLEETR